MDATAARTVSFPPPGELLAWLASGLRAEMRRRGHPLVEDGVGGSADAGIVLHPVDPTAPVGFRRRARAVFVVGLGEAAEAPVEPLKVGYPLLLRTLANIFLLVVRRGPGGVPASYFFTLEQGSYAISHGGSEQAFFEAMVDRLAPLATSRLVIDNIFHADLPPVLREGDEHTAAIARAGRRLAALDLLPAPFPLEDFLSPEDFRHVRQLFNVGGLSYGNLSQRRDEHSFWMSASGVDKGRLREVGRDILLVTGADPDARTIHLSVPPDVRPRRVSVDAVEHHAIYREHPGVGAILHVHAWMEGIPSTDVNFPCGTLELAEAVADLVRRADDPTRAVVGLKNHGLTITGRSLEEIFTRTEGRILRQVPMS